MSAMRVGIMVLGLLTVAAKPKSPAAPKPPVANTPSDKISVAITDLSASQWLNADVVKALTGTVSQTVGELGPFAAISYDDIVRMLNFEAQKQLLGCDATECLAELGGALGVSYVVSGSITPVGQKLLLQLQLTNIIRAKVETRESREYQGDLSGLAGEVRSATKALMRELMSGHRGTLVLAVNEEGATVRVDNRIVGVTPVAGINLASGPHELIVEKEGFVSQRQDISIAPLKDVAVSVALMPSAEFIARRDAERASARRLTYGSLGVGVVGVASAVALYFVGASKADTLERDTNAYNSSAGRDEQAYKELQQRGKTIGQIDVLAVASAVLGIAGISGGLYLHSAHAPAQ